MNQFFTLLCFFITISLSAQTPQLWVEGEPDLDTLVNQGFESGLGSFTNTGILNWTIDNTSPWTGTFCVSSNSVQANQTATLQRIITIPTGVTATLHFYAAVCFLNNNGFASTSFSINGTTQFTDYDCAYRLQTYYLKEGVNTLEWTAAVGNATMGDNVIMYLDDVIISYNQNPIVQIKDGTEGMGKILVSDASGNAHWGDLNEINSFLNNEPSSLVPLVLDGKNTIYAPLTARGASFSGIQSINNRSYGLAAFFNSSDGVSAYSNDDDGLSSLSNADDGLYTTNNDDDGIYSYRNADDGIYSFSNSGDEGYFSGTLYATTMSKGSGTFKIDHPLDPTNKFLYHSFVESPDMMNVYNGNVVLDANGEATVKMADWFDALNKEFRYQLTCIGGYANVYIAEEMRDNQFKIAGGKAGLKVSWQVTGSAKTLLPIKTG